MASTATGRAAAAYHGVRPLRWVWELSRQPVGDQSAMKGLANEYPTPLGFALVVLSSFGLGFLAAWGLFFRDGLIEKYCNSGTLADWSAAIGTFLTMIAAIFVATAGERARERERHSRAMVIADGVVSEILAVEDCLKGMLAEVETAIHTNDPNAHALAIRGVNFWRESVSFPQMLQFRDQFDLFGVRLGSALLRLLVTFQGYEASLTAPARGMLATKLLEVVRDGANLTLRRTNLILRDLQPFLHLKLTTRGF